MKRNSRTAFTLIELLVVIAIIAILAAILFPVFAAAKQAAKKTAALSNFKQQALAALMYANDYDDTFMYNASGYVGANYYTTKYINGALSGMNGAPGAVARANWVAGTYPYVKSLPLYGPDPGSLDEDGTGASNDGWGCYYPNSAAVTAAGLTIDGPTTYCSNYAMNGITAGKSDTAVLAPSDTILFDEVNNKQQVAQVEPQLAFYNNASLGPAGDYPDGTDGPRNYFVWGNGANYSFVDGHAKFRVKSGVSFAEFGEAGTCFYVGGGANAGNPPNIPSGTANAATLYLLDPSLEPAQNSTLYPSYGGWKYDLWNIVCPPAF